jgi:23S rRNA pseudouridine1911/1915/1917 synthase
MSEQNQLHYSVPLSWAGRTLDSLLRHKLNLSRSQIRALKKTAGICLNSKPAWVSARLEGGESLTINLDPAEQHIVPEELPLNIIYEDADLIVINKAAGMIVHPVGVHTNGTLANALVHHWQITNQSASFHPVHRLDRFTSGIIVIAKNPWAHQQLSRQIEESHFHRLYFAICQGLPTRKSAKISAPLQLAGQGFRWEVTNEGKPAITRYRVLAQTTNVSLLAVKLFTGRTHQIRAHFAYLGIPLWGDSIYDQNGSPTLRPALHAVRLSFIHPRYQTRLQFTAPLPEDLQQVLIQTDLKPVGDNHSFKS